jgi:hypothetical protein
MEQDSDDHGDDDATSLPDLEPIDGKVTAAPASAPAFRPPCLNVHLVSEAGSGGDSQEDSPYDSQEDVVQLQPPPAPRPSGLMRLIIGGSMADEDEAADIRQALLQSEAMARQRVAAAPPAPIRQGGYMDRAAPEELRARFIPTFWHACQGTGGHCPGCVYSREYTSRIGRTLAGHPAEDCTNARLH